MLYVLLLTNNRLSVKLYLNKIIYQKKPWLVNNELLGDFLKYLDIKCIFTVLNVQKKKKKQAHLRLL